MNILIPMDNKNIDEAQITKIEELKIWIQVKVEDGKIVSIKENDNWDGFEEFSEIVVVNSDSEYTWNFVEQNMAILVAHFQKSIDDIIEAYLFKELNEQAY